MSDADPLLAGKHLLVLDDEPLLAFDMCDHLRFYGAAVANACTSIDEAMQFIDREERIDCAILDIQIGHAEVWPVAERLSEREIPFVFVSAVCGTRPLPDRFKGRACLPKPVDFLRLRQILSNACLHWAG